MVTKDDIAAPLPSIRESPYWHLQRATDTPLQLRNFYQGVKVFKHSLDIAKTGDPFGNIVEQTLRHRQQLKMHYTGKLVEVNIFRPVRVLQLHQLIRLPCPIESPFQWRWLSYINKLLATPDDAHFEDDPQQYRLIQLEPDTRDEALEAKHTAAYLRPQYWPDKYKVVGNSNGIVKIEEVDETPASQQHGQSSQAIANIPLYGTQNDPVYINE